MNRFAWLLTAVLGTSVISLQPAVMAAKFEPKVASIACFRRGVLKYNELNDISGALADCDRAISLNPQFAQAYLNRGYLKHEKLKDKAGAIQDLRQAAKLFRARGQTQYLQNTVSNLRQLGAIE